MVTFTILIWFIWFIPIPFLLPSSFCTRGSADGCLPPPLQVHDTVLLRAPESAGTIGREKREERREKREES